MAIKANALIGLDIGRDRVKIIKTKSGGRVLHQGYSDVPDGVYQMDREARRGEIAKAISNAAKKAKIRGGTCVILMGGPEVIVRRLSLPSMKPDLVQQNVYNEIAPFLALPVDDYQIGYKVMSVESREKAKVLNLLVAAVQRDDAEDLVACAKKAGFNPKFVDNAENAQDKLVRRLSDSGKVDLQHTAILEVGFSLSNVNIFVDGRYYYSRHIQLDLPRSASECDENFFYADNQSEQALKVRSFADALIADVSSTIDYTYYSGNRTRLSGVYLVGDVCEMDGLCQYISDGLNLPVSLLNKLTNAESSSQYGNAYAATLREN